MTVQTFTDISSWTCPAWVTSVEVECWGAGGAGWGRTTTDGQWGGWGGGAYSKKTVSTTPWNSYSYYAAQVTNWTSGAWANWNDTYWVDASTVMAKGWKWWATNTPWNTASWGAGWLASESVGDVKYSWWTGANWVSTWGWWGSWAGSTWNWNNGSNHTWGSSVTENGWAWGTGRQTTSWNGTLGSDYGAGWGGARRSGSGVRLWGQGARWIIRITYEAVTFSPAMMWHLQQAWWLL